ncbi:hypothetical protein DXG01_000040 [Tephrocybe rancida]|nr:hypothetical protein DXG01_000040 [Tephrocybe rancida]
MTNGLSRTTLVIVIVCVVLGSLLLIFLAANLLRARLRRRLVAPLPPVQPLAHHRIPKYDTLDSRPPSSIPELPLPIPTHSFNSLPSTLPPPPSPPSSRRPLSNASLSSLGNISRRASRTTLRGVPHAPHNQLQIILPAPLASTLPRPLSVRHDTEPSVVDKWIPVGRDDTVSAPNTPRSSRRFSASPSMATSPSAYSYFHPSSPPPPVPQLPDKDKPPS